jgi:hypothetical protein
MVMGGDDNNDNNGDGQQSESWVPKYSRIDER